MHSSTRVDRAGRNLVDGLAATAEEAAQDLDVVNNWRASHAYALNTFQSTLRNKLPRLGITGALVGQRLKRMPSIERKLQRNGRMRLTQMQDIAGLRVVLQSTSDLDKLVRDYHGSRFDHIRTDTDDYLQEPKSDGYRSVHLMYRYQSRFRQEYNRCRVELQVRTRLQHAWATAVETIDAFLGQDIKAGNAAAEWARFFVVASALLADREDLPRPTELRAIERQTLVDELRSLEHSLQLRNRLGGYASTLTQMGKMPSSTRTHAYYLVVLNTQERW
ncbi:(p)ppGpp synthetase, partial [Mycobacterium tuberculosis]